ncbi:MAG: hypothetical protein AB1586_00975 [Pseudomonadota bacterium]
MDVRWWRWRRPRPARSTPPARTRRWRAALLLGAFVAVLVWLALHAEPTVVVRGMRLLVIRSLQGAPARTDAPPSEP